MQNYAGWPDDPDQSAASWQSPYQLSGGDAGYPVHLADPRGDWDWSRDAARPPWWASGVPPQLGAVSPWPQQQLAESIHGVHGLQAHQPWWGPMSAAQQQQWGGAGLQEQQQQQQMRRQHQQAAKSQPKPQSQVRPTMGSWAQNKPQPSAEDKQAATVAAVAALAAEGAPGGKMRPLDLKRYTILIRDCGRQRSWQAALQLLHQMQEEAVEPNVITYTATISACEKGKQWAKALWLLQQMRSHNVKVDMITYSSAINACEKAQRWEKASELLQQMRQEGLEPNVITYKRYKSAIGACEKNSQWAKSLELLVQMREESLEPNLITCNTAIRACEKTQQWSRALDLLEQMRQEALEPDVNTYNSVLIACEKGLHPTRALHLLRHMQQNVVQPDANTLAGAICACESTHEWGRALMFLKEIWELEAVPASSSCEAVISACVKASQWAKALELLPRMKQAGVDCEQALQALGPLACKEPVPNLPLPSRKPAADRRTEDEAATVADAIESDVARFLAGGDDEEEDEEEEIESTQQATTSAAESQPQDGWSEVAERWQKMGASEFVPSVSNAKGGRPPAMQISLAESLGNSDNAGSAGTSTVSSSFGAAGSRPISLEACISSASGQGAPHAMWI
eukprot:gnl/TRDRNA2_/TRDRNA2_175015_c7_seq10.p1 gnl/TRDRNA2_/TRDRNA2_175015_c7~~gnl/TRDRNA2_/TRDRNA2_175015_c7_seq10.p1  ORF type:complete len:653 (-),score=123.39 gnl/TRDRNA2_/TRDRNA2_175015_c7_seq10:186-2069(-)